MSCFPEHRVYVEPYIGGGSVLLNKPKAEKEVAGDLDDGLINLWWHLDCAAFHSVMKHTPYEEHIFDVAGKASLLSDNTDLDRAVFYIVRNRFSRGGLGKTFAWSDRLRGGQPGDANAWETIRAELPAISDRVKDVDFRCCEALDLIRDFDGPNTVMYLDPPYLASTRTAKKAYAHEMTREDHEELLFWIGSASTTWFLSGYRSRLYDEAAEGEGWHRREFDMPNHSGQGKSKQRRTEVLWSNRPFPGSVPCDKAEAAAD